MATLKNRTIKFIDEGIERIGIIVDSSPLGALKVNIIDGIDDTKQIILQPETPVRFWRIRK